jgi:phosphoribosyl 1,2-cyclic phosphodiesterase
MKSFLFCPLASGSSGNSAYCGLSGAGILIDAGLSGIRAEKALSSIGASVGQLKAIFATHEHIDHICGMGVLSRRCRIPVYATQATWDSFDSRNSIGKVDKSLRRVITPGVPVEAFGMEVEAFRIPHDAADPVGYIVRANGKKAVVATDIGHASAEVREGIKDADALILESNHDLDMLWNGRYPKVLKERINGDKGHLSNDAAGELLACAVSGRLKRVYLGHLSEENNSPLIAFCAASAALGKLGAKRVSLVVAQRHLPSEAVEL